MNQKKLSSRQQALFDEYLSTQSKPVVQKKDIEGIFPDRIHFLSDDTEVVHLGNGVFKYVKSKTKSGEVPIMLSNIKSLESFNLIKTCND